MKKLLSFLLSLFPLLVFAQDKAAEASAETANPVVVIAFLALFVGGCLAYVIYAVLTNKKKGAEVEGE